MRCDVIAAGILQALKALGMSLCLITLKFFCLVYLNVFSDALSPYLNLVFSSSPLYLPILPSTYISNYVSINLPMFLSIYLCFYQSISLSINLSINFCILLRITL